MILTFTCIFLLLLSWFARESEMAKNMMFNSSFLNVETPVKVVIRRKEELTPVKCVDTSKRFSPSVIVKKQLAQIEQCHQFQFHEDVKFIPLKELGLNNKLLQGLSNFFQSHLDIPDIVIKHEEIAYDYKYFNSYMRDYIAEEFNTQPEYSFCIISVLHYMQKYSINFEDALYELFDLSTNLSLCYKCVSGEDMLQRRKLADMHNIRFLKRVKTDTDMSDVPGSDDSFADAEFKVDTHQESTSDDASSSKSSEDETEFNPFSSTQSQDINEGFSFSPFVDTESNCEIEKKEENEFLNSTPDINPFARPDQVYDFEGFGSISSIPVIKSRLDLTCAYCEKKFTNRHNLKLHLISVHKIFPKGMSIFKCKYPNQCVTMYGTVNRSPPQALRFL